MLTPFETLQLNFLGWLFIFPNLVSLGELCLFLCIFKVDIKFCIYYYCYKTNINWLILYLYSDMLNQSRGYYTLLSLLEDTPSYKILDLSDPLL